MASYSVLERKIAKILREIPWFKDKVKKAYQYIMLFIYFPKYKAKSKYAITKVSSCKEETFFGYYDKSPRFGEFEIFHSTMSGTKNTPLDVVKKDGKCNIKVVNYTTGEIVFDVQTHAFNWQQGSKPQWLEEGVFIYNDLLDGSPVAIRVDLLNNTRKVLDYPVYDSYSSEFYLSLDYMPLSILRPDYGYFNSSIAKPIKYDDQSICYHDFNGKSQVLFDISYINNKFPLPYDCSFDRQKFNHIMISPDGNKFVFLHRSYNKNSSRLDRLFSMVIDEGKGSIKLISDLGMVSHYNWVDSDNLIVYMSHSGVDSYYVLNVNSSEVENVGSAALNSFGDGHPTYIGNGKVLTDTYPNRSRLKSLIIFDINTKEIDVIGEFYEPMKYANQTRCDLHPRWDASSRCIYIDSVHDGSRQLYRLSPLSHNN